jgi:methylmalonyl-CoA epimerase
MLQQIEHIAIVVQDLEAALYVYRDVLGLQLMRVEEVPVENVKVAFLKLPRGEGHIELVQPTDSESGIARFLNKRGEGVHHICFRVENVAAAMSQLLSAGLETIGQDVRINREGRPYTFVHPKSAHGVLIELYEATSP